MAILRYEERVRIERANGLRKPDPCTDGKNCSVYSDDEYKGKQFHEVAATPLRMNQVCPHPKVVVPVTPAYLVTEDVKDIKVTYPAGHYQLVDFNHCDGRTIGVLETINDSHTAVQVSHSTTEHSVEEVVEDTAYDEPRKVKRVKSKLKEDAAVAQPQKTGDIQATDKTVDVSSGN